MPDFFPRGHGIGVFLNAGDPPLELLGDLLQVLDESGVDCAELAVPFPDSVTDGPVIRRSAARALARGVGLPEALAAVDRVRDRLRRLRVVLLADWKHTVVPLGGGEFATRLAGSGVDATLVHGGPPRFRRRQFDLLAEVGVPVVATCYAQSAPKVRAQAARDATAFVYLVAHYGRSGRNSTVSQGLRETIGTLRADTEVPVAVGFGIRTAADVRRVHELGAQGALVGTAAVELFERDGDPVRLLEDFVRPLHEMGYST